MPTCSDVGEEERKLVAYQLYPDLPSCLLVAPVGREWMKGTNNHFANRCLPMLIANQSGWFIANSQTLQATWDGGDTPESVSITYPDNLPPPLEVRAVSHFGHGIMTWTLPYLFRTPPGYNLLVRGPANCPKDGVYALEGIVETDWAVAPFTMNWKITRPHHAVTFAIDEPICMLVPQRQGTLEDFHPEIQRLGQAPGIAASYQKWSEARATFLADLKQCHSEAARSGWQKDYFQGVLPDGTPVPSHQQKLTLRPFEVESVS